jgi:hypothetical protein
VGKRIGVTRRNTVTPGDPRARRHLAVPRSLVVLTSAAAIAVVPAACGDTKDASQCTAFAEWVDARAAINAIDPTSQLAADEIEAVENYLASVRRLRQVGDGRYAQQIENLEAAVNDAVLTLESVRDDADYETWGPLLEDDIEAATDAADQVDKAIRPSCEAALEASALEATVSKVTET